jgi:hypothetical protein
MGGPWKVRQEPPFVRDPTTPQMKHLHRLDVASFGGSVAVAVARTHIGSVVQLGYPRVDVPPIGNRNQIIGLLRIIPAHDNPPCCQTPLFENAGNIRPPDESEGTISLKVVLLISFAAHTDNVATKPSSSGLESSAINPVTPTVHRDSTLFL